MPTRKQELERKDVRNSFRNAKARKTPNGWIVEWPIRGYTLEFNTPYPTEQAALSAVHRMLWDHSCEEHGCESQLISASPPQSRRKVP